MPTANRAHHRRQVAIGFAISIALLIPLGWNLDFPHLGALLRQTDWRWVAPAIILTPIGLWVRARRWYYLFPPNSNPEGLVSAVMIGFLVNNLLPLRIGEIVRAYVVARRWRHGFWTAIATLVVERVLDGAVVVLVVAALTLAVPVPNALKWAGGMVLTADGLLIILLSAVVSNPDNCRKVLKRSLARWPNLGSRAARGLDTFLLGLQGIRAPRHVLPIIVGTALIWVIPVVTAWTTLRAVGLPLPWTAAWTVVAFVALGISIPSAPGYVGTYHAAAAMAIAVFGAPQPAAVAYALILHASQFVPVTLLGWMFLLREQLTLESVARDSVLGRKSPAP